MDKEELKKYTINLYDLLGALIEYGQHDKQFKLGDIIKYDPVSVIEIAKGFLDKERNMSNEKPPLGVNPAWLVAWSRIGELIGAIERQYESHHDNAKLCEACAEEIKLQCEIIETMKLYE